MQSDQRSSLELQSLSILSSRDAEDTSNHDEIEQTNLPPTDRGKDAWLMLASCCVIQLPVWGTYSCTPGITADDKASPSSPASFRSISRATMCYGVARPSCQWSGLPVPYVPWHICIDTWYTDSLGNPLPSLPDNIYSPHPLPPFPATLRRHRPRPDRRRVPALVVLCVRLAHDCHAGRAVRHRERTRVQSDHAISGPVVCAAQGARTRDYVGREEWFRGCAAVCRECMFGQVWGADDAEGVDCDYGMRFYFVPYRC